jgi:hypothetical protein
MSGCRLVPGIKEEQKRKEKKKEHVGEMRRRAENDIGASHLGLMRCSDC